MIQEKQMFKTFKTKSVMDCIRDLSSSSDGSNSNIIFLLTPPLSANFSSFSTSFESAEGPAPMTACITSAFVRMGVQHGQSSLEPTAPSQIRTGLLFSKRLSAKFFAVVQIESMSDGEYLKFVNFYY